MSWLNELRENIKFKSPSGKTHYALWRNNDRSVEKKLGIFNPPAFHGTIVQDLDVQSTKWPLTVYFDGPFHNRDAEDFYNDLSTEVGQWEVVHPVKGPVILQLVSFTEKISPVENGNYTEFETEWIEPANQDRVISLSELVSSVLSQALVAIEDTITVLNQLKADIYSAVASATGMFNKIVGFMDSITKETSAVSALVLESYETARAAYTSAINNFSVSDSDTDDVAEAMINMVIAPVNASSDFGSRFTAYQDLLDAQYALTPVTTTRDDYNAVIAQEFGISISLIAIAQIAATSEFGSRSDVVSAMDNITTIFNNTIAALEVAQENFSGLDIDFQYFSQTKTYTSLVQLFALVMRMLLQQFFSLRAEKRFTLKNARSPIEITVTEYGSLGDSDANYDLFLTSNQLSGTDILILPAGREVIIYAGS